MDLQELLDNARRNEALLKRLQNFELKLLACQHWHELLTVLLVELPNHFQLQAVGLKLCDEDGSMKASIQYAVDIEQAVLLKDVEFFKSLPTPALGIIKPPSPWVSGLSLPLWRNGQCIGQLCLYSSHTQRFSPDLATDFIQHLAAVVAACLVLVKQNEEQMRLALTDPLTLAENRRGFERSFTREWARGMRRYHEFSLLLLDIDWFKQINDSHGHATGDRALRQLCDTIRHSLRPTDHLGRLGGEEFIVLLSDCDPARLRMVAQRIQSAIRAMRVLNDQGQGVQITTSGSYITLLPKPYSSANLTTVLKHLDCFLYQAKEAGRDCYIAANRDLVDERD